MGDFSPRGAEKFRIAKTDIGNRFFHATGN
jgi:hypothetical protein